MDRQIEEFLRYLVAEKRFSPNTISAYRNDLTQFLQQVRSGEAVTDWHQVGPAQLVEFALFLRSRKYANSTVARKTAAIKSFFHYLADGTVRCLGKGGRERVIPIRLRAVEAVKAYLQRGRPAMARMSKTEALFLIHRGELLKPQGLRLIRKGEAV